jgi:hypothetical protein
MGDLLLGADFSNQEMPGWVVVNREKLEFKPGDSPALMVRFPASKSIHPVVRTPAPFDDFDVSVSMCFLEGPYDQISAGLELRSCDQGDYVVRVSAQGTFNVGWHVKTEWGGHLVKWTRHPILRTEMGDWNRLRVIMRGSRIRIYLNGVLVTSLRDTRYTSGLVRLVVSPGNDAPLEMLFSDLQLRELI